MTSLEGWCQILVGAEYRGCDQEIWYLDIAVGPVWVEIWVENRWCLESVEASAAWSRPVHRDA